ncbi:MAG: hypothetical protein IPN94_16715 [Sphingobacteriales bacterium]|nr:hypothetical protein [Sphingobacteriales bacterium]
MDDYAQTPFNTAVSGNVSTNDTDPEGDNQTVVAQTTTVLRQRYFGTKYRRKLHFYTGKWI